MSKKHQKPENEQERGDVVLKRMLKTPPKPKIKYDDKAHQPTISQKDAKKKLLTMRQGFLLDRVANHYRINLVTK